MRLQWCDGSKVLVPKSRGRDGHTKRLGTCRSKSSQYADCRAIERKVRQEGKRICREEHFSDSV